MLIEKKCYTGLSKKLDLWHIDKLKLGLPEASLFLLWKFDSLWSETSMQMYGNETYKEIHSIWSSNGVSKLWRTMNERAISIEDKIELLDIYTDSVIWERQK